jgi:C4-type Zn-finger protein
MEHACGRVAFQIPELGKIGEGSFNEAVISTIEHLGELSRKYRAAMADNVLSLDEKRELESLKYEIMRHVMSLLEDITK